MAGISKRVSGAWVSGSERIMKPATDIIVPPTTIYADGTNATVGLKGNMSQTGTPTPTTPIQPSECGERTGNLFDADTIYSTYKQSDGTYQAARSVFYGLKVKPFSAEDIGKTFTFAMSISPVSGNVRVCGNIGGAVINGDSAARSVITFTVASVDDTLYLNYGSGGDVVTTLSDTMLNSGSTAKPYEPFGYKIPISSANTTTPVYLGEVETTRKIKKLELTGNETVEPYQCASTNGVRINNILLNVQKRGEGYCNIYPVKTEAGTSHCVWIGSGGGDYNIYFISILTDLNLSTTDEFKQYLAQQYSAGTPVTVWYVLATPQTAVVNEPLRKIGDYADEVSGISIPTTTGADSFDVLTTLKPSEISLTYHGWHEGTVHERDSGAWD